jgi:transcriptional regulator with XRE-family HTH domain
LVSHARILRETERIMQARSLSAPAPALRLAQPLMTLSDLIRSSRKRQGLTQVELAKLMSVNKSAVAQWELGHTEPSVDKLSRLREVLHIDRSAEAAAGLPNGYEFVEDPEKLAWLRWFDLMDDTERLIAARMIRGAVTLKRGF